MRIPVWLTLGVAILVILFGVHRIRLSFRSEEEEGRARQRKGLYAMGRRTHRLIGIVYILLGGALVAATFGWSPFGDLFGPPTEAPPRHEAPAGGAAGDAGAGRPPSSTSVPIDQLPPPKPNK